MPFAVGVVLGFGIGLAGAILMAPEKKRRGGWPPHMAGEHSENGAGFVESVKERLGEAVTEAKEARKQAEKEMIARYERSVGRKSK